MSETKIGLSPEELELAGNASLILTKNVIIQKTIKLFSEIQQEQKKIIENSSLPEPLLNSSPKISKGEFYKGLPYVVLDYPRWFEKNNIAAVRSMFWWGNFFSVTLHLSGAFKKSFQKSLARHPASLSENDFYFCIGESEWEHHFEKTNYIPVKELSQTELPRLMEERDFIKLAYSFPVSKWNESAAILLQYFSFIIEMMEIRHQDDETGP